MTALAIALGVLLLFAAIAAAWLAAQRASLQRALRDRDDALSRLNDSLSTSTREANDHRAQAAALAERIKGLEHRLTEDAERNSERLKQLQETFDALASRALDASTKRFLELAQQRFATQQKEAGADLELRKKAVEDLVKPIADTLKKTDEKLAAIEKERAQHHASLVENIRNLREAGDSLRMRTDDLVNALRKPQVRGAYGEMILERVVELAGMRSYCHFSAQESKRDSSDNLLRPDMVVRLPNERCIVIDAKTNIEAYLEAVHARDPNEADAHLDRFARHVADQADKLAKKDYTAIVEGSPEFVVMFIPGDQFIDAALERKPDLLEYAAQRNVILASPSTLIGLLRAVHVGWREKQLSDSAEELFNLGRTLHERIAVALDHAMKVGQGIETARKAWNNFVGSVSSRLLPAIRTFEDRGAHSTKELPTLPTLEGETRDTPQIETRPIDPHATPLPPGERSQTRRGEAG